MIQTQPSKNTNHICHDDPPMLHIVHQPNAGKRTVHETRLARQLATASWTASVTRAPVSGKLIWRNRVPAKEIYHERQETGWTASHASCRHCPFLALHDLCALGKWTGRYCVVPGRVLGSVSVITPGPESISRRSMQDRVNLFSRKGGRNMFLATFRRAGTRDKERKGLGNETPMSCCEASGVDYLHAPHAA